MLHGVRSATIVAPTTDGYAPNTLKTMRIACALLLAVACGGAPVADDVGFVDVPGARLFYVFRKADVENAPLVVFFNGGPGYATSFGLLAHGTSPATVDSSGALVANGASWTSFANLLYIDERQSGFSYGVGTAPGACAFDPVADAADFAQALLRFFDAHQALRHAPVVLVGESYGGMRAMYVLAQLRASGDAKQFGHVVLLEPFLLGRAQIDAQAATIGSDPYVGTVDTTKDPYDVRQPVGYTDGLSDAVANALAGGGATELFGTSFSEIPRFGPADRLNAFRTPATVADRPPVLALDTVIASEIGALTPTDAYAHVIATECADVSAPFTSATGALDVLVANVGQVKTFISQARYDANVYTPAIFTALGTLGHPEVIAAMHLATYDASGHMIEVSEAQKLHDDVALWLTQ
jgi:pimeloyl-ACP methyl ester carboxylesterase